MKQYNRVCARINLDAIAYNMEQMKNRIGQEGRLIAVIKTDAYGHGAVPLAEMFEETPYIWGYAVACMGEARTLRAHGIKKPILILGCVFPDEYEEMVEKEIRAAKRVLRQFPESANFLILKWKECSHTLQRQMNLTSLIHLPNMKNSSG